MEHYPAPVLVAGVLLAVGGLAWVRRRIGQGPLLVPADRA